VRNYESFCTPVDVVEQEQAYFAASQSINGNEQQDCSRGSQQSLSLLSFEERARHGAMWSLREGQHTDRFWGPGFPRRFRACTNRALRVTKKRPQSLSRRGKRFAIPLVVGFERKELINIDQSGRR
jgi:hypothetical protein